MATIAIVLHACQQRAENNNANKSAKKKVDKCNGYILVEQLDGNNYGRGKKGIENEYMKGMIDKLWMFWLCWGEGLIG